MAERESLLVPQYPGDDTRPTSKKELAGWYSYSWAAEVFVVCAMGSFLPVTLEQMARDQGHLAYDKNARCDSKPISTRAAGGIPLPEPSQCIIHVFGLEINTASFAMYTFSLSVLIQALLIITMSGAADHGSYRKMLLVIFASVGSISLMLFLAVRPEIYLVGSLLAVIANTAFGASWVLLNSFLPLLVRHHPELLEKTAERMSPPVQPDLNHSEEGDAEADANTPLLQSRTTSNGGAVADGSLDAEPERLSLALQLSTRISSYGMGIGYIGAIILQISCIGIVVLAHQTSFSLRLVLFVIGLWWFLFTIPSALWLRPRPGPPLPLKQTGSRRRAFFSYMIFSWASLGRTVMHARHLKDVIIFLAAWFLLSDGIATVSGTAILFAKTELGMRPAALGMISVTGTLCGIIGAFSWSYISRKFQLRAIHTIITCISLLLVVPLYGLLGAIPAVQQLGFLGLQNPWEVFPIAAIYGLVMGGLSSYCRSLYGELVPPGYEAAFYALYAITDKGSSVFGPAIVGLITDRFGAIRPAFVFLALLVFSSLPLMLLVDVERGKRDAIALAAELDGRQKNGAYQDQTIQMVDEEAENN
ncbi:hypothetical protein VTN31DRAFT_2685 [Thermomyces dupontii]|uniref:uncharacterized protein n=1 Tax=Talaromyces thermophilus TaxID=28565 RepID=UPI00374399A3